MSKSSDNTGHWKGTRTFLIDAKVAESQTVTSFYLRPEDGGPLAAYKPGQFLTLAVPSDRDGLAARCYSLSSSPHDGGPLTVTVKRTVDGYASNWVCDHLEVGSTMRVLPPSGIFTPASLDADLLLFGGGLSLAKAVAATGLDQWIGNAIGGFAGALPLIGIVLLVATVILLLTEFTSNTATAATFLPLVAALSQWVLIEKATGKLVRVPAEVAAPFLYETRRKEENE